MATRSVLFDRMVGEKPPRPTWNEPYDANKWTAWYTYQRALTDSAWKVSNWFKPEVLNRNRVNGTKISSNTYLHVAEKETIEEYEATVATFSVVAFDQEVLRVTAMHDTLESLEGETTVHEVEFSRYIVSGWAGTFSVWEDNRLNRLSFVNKLGFTGYNFRGRPFVTHNEDMAALNTSGHFASHRNMRHAKLSYIDAHEIANLFRKPLDTDQMIDSKGGYIPWWQTAPDARGRFTVPLMAERANRPPIDTQFLDVFLPYLGRKH